MATIHPKLAAKLPPFWRAALQEQRNQEWLGLADQYWISRADLMHQLSKLACMPGAGRAKFRALLEAIDAI